MKEPERTYPPTESYTVRGAKDNVLGIKESHPSYGTIAISHVQGSAPLFDSDVVNHHLVEITIQEADKFVDGDREMIMGHGKSLARVWMSAAQFAEMITTPNRGSGTPCTIKHIYGDQAYDTRFGDRPEPPRPQPFTERFKEEGRERVRLMLSHMDNAKALVDKLVSSEEKPTKANFRELAQRLAAAMQEIRSNLPYVLTSLEEQVEKRMQHAVTEFESYVSVSLQRRGLESIDPLRLAASVNPEPKALGDGLTDEEKMAQHERWLDLEHEDSRQK